MILTRRGLIGGLASVLAAPAIVRASSLMPVKAWAPYSDEVAIKVLSAEYGAPFIQYVDLRPGALNYAEPHPDWRFRAENGMLLHEPDPDAVKAA